MDATVDAAQSLTRTPQNAERLARAGLLPLVLQALSQNATNARVVEPACKALLNMATVKSLRTALLDAKVPDAIRPFADAAAYSLRVSDAARGCLLHLGQLQDQQAQEAIAESEAAAGAAGGGAPGGSAGAAAAAGGFRPGAAPSQPQQPSFDVFLSHKRTDSKDFARALYNLLVLRGISCFLDFEYREELSDLESIVASCANLVFILTDNIFESQWCMKELVAAAKNNVNIILVVKEGSRWKDKHGNRTHDFPPYWLLDSLQPPEVRSVFSRKSIAHSDEVMSWLSIACRRCWLRGAGAECCTCSGGGMVLLDARNGEAHSRQARCMGPLLCTWRLPTIMLLVTHIGGAAANLPPAYWRSTTKRSSTRCCRK